METFAKLFGSLLDFVYHCFDRIVILGYLRLTNAPQFGGNPLSDAGYAVRLPVASIVSSSASAMAAEAATVEFGAP